MKKTDMDAVEQVLIFGLGDEWYGLEISLIQEVVAAPKTYDIPRAPCSLLGAINFHGSVVPVLDLSAWLGFASSDKDPRVIVLAGGECRLALAVDRIRRIVPFAEDNLVPYEPERGEENFIRAVLTLHNDMINLLDVSRLTASLTQLTAC